MNNCESENSTTLLSSAREFPIHFLTSCTVYNISIVAFTESGIGPVTVLQASSRVQGIFVLGLNESSPLLNFKYVEENYKFNICDIVHWRGQTIRGMMNLLVPRA